MESSTSPIRVVHLIARLNIGGAAVVVSLLVSRLRPPVFDSRLVCGRIGATEGDMQYYAEQLGLEPILIPELGRELHPLRDLVTIWKVYRLLRRLRPDVVHTHTAKAGFVGRIAARLAGVPVIVHTFHGHVFYGVFRGPRARLMEHVSVWLERFAARFCDRILTLSNRLRHELAEDFHIAPPSRIAVLPIPVDLTVFDRMPRHIGTFRQAWNIPPDAPLVGLIGRLVPMKYPELFVQAAARVKAQQPDARFVIVGDGELRGTVEALVESLDLREAVTFTGWQRDMAAIYSDLDVLAVSSQNEGTPVTLIEAVTARCPVVSTAVGGVPDLLDAGALGTLVPPGDAEALAEGILAALRNPPDMAQASQTIQARHDADNVTQQLGALYRQLLAEKRR
ncbi:MAG: glycosyltransferase family 4 protein [Chloroflexi bacterium]|nr:glycosyltransferase family 4 protein [Chloroflexota bacterium]